MSATPQALSRAFEELLKRSGLTPEEIEGKRHLLARIALETDAHFERTAINQDKKEPGKTYVWVEQDQNTRAKYESLGYRPCKTKDIAPVQFQRRDGTYQNGDAVLYEVDSDTWEARKWAAQLESFQRTQKPVAEQRFVNFARKQGGKAEVAEPV